MDMIRACLCLNNFYTFLRLIGEKRGIDIWLRMGYFIKVSREGLSRPWRCLDAVCQAGRRTIEAAVSKRL